MTNSLIGRIACAFGFHKMPKWGAPKAGVARRQLDDSSYPSSIQERTCEECGAVKLRFAK